MSNITEIGCALAAAAFTCHHLGVDPVGLEWVDAAGVLIHCRTRADVDTLAAHHGLPPDDGASANYRRGTYGSLVVYTGRRERVAS